MLLTREQQEIFDNTSIPKYLTINFYIDSPYFEFPEDDIYPSDDFLPGPQSNSVLIDSLSGSRIVSSSLSITESISNANTLVFGTVTANKLSVKIETDIDVTGLFVEVKIKAESVEIPLFYGVVDTAKRSTITNRDLIQITAYDILYSYLDLDCTDWYNNLDFPMTILELRTSLANTFGLVYSAADLVNDSVEVDKYTLTTGNIKITARNLLKYICEINGVFANVNRKNEIVFISLVPYQLLYPNNDLLPDDDLTPGIQTDSVDTKTIHRYIPSNYGEYKTQKISKVEVYDNKNNLLYSYGNGDNVYVIKDNYMTSTMSESDLETAIENFYYLVSNISYIPMTLNCQSFPYLEVGDVFNIPIGNKQITSFILQRTLTFTRDKLEAKGEEYQSNKQGKQPTFRFEIDDGDLKYNSANADDPSFEIENGNLTVTYTNGNEYVLEIMQKYLVSK